MLHYAVRTFQHMRSFVGVLTVLVLSAPAATAADAKAGRALYDEECKDCHGAKGAPSAKLQNNLKIKMKDLSGSEVQTLSDAELRKRSIEGFGKMKPVKTITGPAVDDVIAYVRTLKK